MKGGEIMEDELLIILKQATEEEKSGFARLLVVQCFNLDPQHLYDRYLLHFMRLYGARYPAPSYYETLQETADYLGIKNLYIPAKDLEIEINKKILSKNLEKKVGKEEAERTVNSISHKDIIYFILTLLGIIKKPMSSIPEMIINIIPDIIRWINSIKERNQIPVIAYISGVLRK